MGFLGLVLMMMVLRELGWRGMRRCCPGPGLAVGFRCCWFRRFAGRVTVTLSLTGETWRC